MKRAFAIEVLLLLSVLGGSACDDKPAAVAPAPSAAVAVPVAEPPAVHIAPSEPAPPVQPTAAEPVVAPVVPVTEGAPRAATTKPKSDEHVATASPKPETPQPKPIEQVVAAPTPTPKPAASSKVVVPSTAHVHVVVPAGLQAWLDADDRMQPWVNKVIATIDKCHSQNAGASGTIVAGIVMHENARPDADIKSLPPALSGVVACATTGLMSNRMPLFTGKENEHYTLKIEFAP